MSSIILSSLLLLAAEAAASGVVTHKLHRKAGLQRARASSNKALDTPLDFRNDWINAGGYFITLEAGTPPQSFELLVDTGSSDLFVPSADAANCKLGLCAGGTYEAADSSTYSVVSGAPQFHIEYADGSIVDGEYSKETVSVEGVALTNITFSVADEIQVSPWATDDNGNPTGPQYGIMGVNVLAGQSASNFTYTTVPLALKQQGYTQSWSYSLYLDDIESDDGQIIFGGIDTAKYHGELTTLQVDPSLAEQSVYGNGFAVSRDGQTKQLTGVKPFSALLDSGRAGWDIPQSAFNQIALYFKDWSDAVVDYSGERLLPCSFKNKDASITVGLTDGEGAAVTVEVPLSNALIPALTSETTDNYNDTKPLILNGTEQCIFTVYPSPDNSSHFTLGDPFFRSAYLFFNLDESTISVGQASYDAEGSNIVPVGGSAGGSGNVSTIYPTGSGSNSSIPSYTGAAGSNPTVEPSIGAANTLQSAGVLSALVVVAAMISW